MTIPLTVISFAIALVIALFTAIVQIAEVPMLKPLARLYVWIIRGTPLLVQLFVVFYGLPSLGIVLDAFLSAIIVFSINTGAYASETIRAAIEAVPPRSDGSRLLCRHDLCPMHAPDYSAAGFAHSFPAVKQFTDRLD